MKYDAFVCFASDDRATVAIPIIEGLKKEGYKIRAEELSTEDIVTVREKIENGLGNSKYGIIILSEVFLQIVALKSDLDGFLIRQNLSGEKLILPVWHNITPGIIEKYSAALVYRVSAFTDRGIDWVVSLLVPALHTHINLNTQELKTNKRRELEKLITKQKYTMNLYNEWHSDLIRESRIAVSAWVRQFADSSKKMPGLITLREEHITIVIHINRLLLYYEQWAVFSKKKIIDKELIMKLLSSYLVWYDNIFISPMVLANELDGETATRLKLIREEVFSDQMHIYNSLKY